MSATSRFFSVESITAFIAGPRRVAEAIEHATIEGLVLDESGWLQIMTALSARFRVANILRDTVQSPAELHLPSPLRVINMVGAIGITASAVALFITEICCFLNGITEPRVCEAAACPPGEHLQHYRAAICEIRHTTEFNVYDCEGRTTNTALSVESSTPEIIPIAVNLTGCFESDSIRAALITA